MATADKKARDKKVEQLIQDMFASSDVIAIKSLKALRTLGDSRAIAPMLRLYAVTDNEEIRRETREMLFSLKSTRAIVPLMEALRDEGMAKYRSFILAVFWNSGLEPIGYVKQIVDVAIDGNYEEVLEALTVVENLENKIDPKILESSLNSLNKAMEAEKDGHKKDLLSSLQLVLENRLAAYKSI